MNAKDNFEARWQRLAERWEMETGLPPGLRALITDIVELQATPALPPPDLSFLPRISLKTYVRQVGEHLSRLYFPEVSGGLQAAADAFFRRLDTRRHHLIMENPPVYLTHTPDPMTVMTATYVATVRLRELDDPTLRDNQAQFALAAYDIAITEAQRHGLGNEEADRFAAGFADMVRSTAGMFGRLEIPK